MTGRYKLPARLDLSVAMQLVSDLRKLDGDIHVDASNVTHMGALCVQALIATARKADAEGRKFEISGVTDKVLEQMKVMGTAPEQMMEGAR